MRNERKGVGRNERKNGRNERGGDGREKRMMEETSFSFLFTFTGEVHRIDPCPPEKRRKKAFRIGMAPIAGNI